MKKITLLTGILLPAIIFCFSYSQLSCNQPAEAQKTDSSGSPKELSRAELLSRGKYIVATIGCNDCHSPKIFTPNGPVVDSTKILSGHPAGAALPAIDKNALKPGNWLLFSSDLTATVGPWGISYSANLTPDTATGIGAWTEDVFIKTIRTGKHLGQEGGRQILPPMPWDDFNHCTDDDLKAIFTYLKAIPAISNKVPQPISPNEVAKMK
jgi:hypothetical protein